MNQLSMRPPPRAPRGWRRPGDLGIRRRARSPGGHRHPAALARVPAAPRVVYPGRLPPDDDVPSNRTHRSALGELLRWVFARGLRVGLRERGGGTARMGVGGGERPGAAVGGGNPDVGCADPDPRTALAQASHPGLLLRQHSDAVDHAVVVVRHPVLAGRDIAADRCLGVDDGDSGPIPGGGGLGRRRVSRCTSVP